MTFLQRLLDNYQAGLQITAVKMQFAGPPEEVKDAFDEVVRAREDKQRLIREAEGYAADRVPKARGEAEREVLAAEAFKEQRVLQAEGDSTRFLKILREHEVPAAMQALADSGNAEAMDSLRSIGASEELLSSDADEAPAMTREGLFEILDGMGVIEEGQQSEYLTGPNLLEAMSDHGLADEYQAAIEEALSLTRKRIYLETMEDVMVGVEKFVIDSQTGGDLLPFLPLKELTGAQNSQEAN